MDAPTPDTREAFCYLCRAPRVFERTKLKDGRMFCCTECCALRELTIRPDERDASAAQRRHHGGRSA